MAKMAADDMVGALEKAGVKRIYGAPDRVPHPVEQWLRNFL
ncbi:hypothetical protein [Paraburkholderia sp. SIMBA_030]